MKITVAIVVLSFAALSCSQPSTDKSAQNRETTTTPASSFSTLPVETLRTLVAECDYIDLIVYNPSFSMSQSEAASIQATLQQIGDGVPAHNPSNQPFGRIFYQSKGETLLEADVYLGQTGSYFIFYQDKKQAFANVMTTQGVNFYINIINRLQGGEQQQG
jgi:hypothetical protein